jgi:class 3 adenylate cyclase
MSLALAQHDALSRSAVESNGGIVVKMTGDGMYAAFAAPLDAVNATVMLQRSLEDPGATHGIVLKVRYGLHVAPSSGATTISSAVPSIEPRES